MGTLVVVVGVAGAAGVEPAPMDSRLERFHKVLSQTTVNLDHLRALAWNGIPAELRPTCWRLLLVRLPCTAPSSGPVPLSPIKPWNVEGVQGGPGAC